MGASFGCWVFFLEKVYCSDYGTVGEESSIQIYAPVLNFGVVVIGFTAK